MGKTDMYSYCLSKRATLAKNIIFTIAQTDMAHKHKHTSNLSSGEEIENYLIFFPFFLFLLSSLLDKEEKIKLVRLWGKMIYDTLLSAMAFLVGACISLMLHTYSFLNSCHLYFEIYILKPPCYPPPPV